MQRRKLAWLAGVALATLLLLPHGAAAEIEEGGSAWSLQLVEGNADFGLYDRSTGFITLVRHSEIGFQAQYWHQWSEKHAFTLAGGVGFSRETQIPGVDALAGEQSFRSIFLSWQGRLGVDRIAKLGERFHLYAGPGLHFWTGSIELARGLNQTYKGENTYRFGADGRVGVMMSWSTHWGMSGQIGHYWAYTYATEQAAETKLIAGGPSGMMGIYYTY